MRQSFATARDDLGPVAPTSYGVSSTPSSACGTAVSDDFNRLLRQAEENRKEVLPVTRKHAHRRHSLRGDDWAIQHVLDHVSKARGLAWAHRHDPDDTWHEGYAVYDDPELLACPRCEGPLVLLGTLGHRQHFACRDCGWLTTVITEAAR